MDAVVGEEDAQEWTEPGVPELTVLVHNVLVSAAISFYQLLYIYTINEKKNLVIQYIQVVTWPHFLKKYPRP